MRATPALFAGGFLMPVTSLPRSGREEKMAALIGAEPTALWLVVILVVLASGLAWALLAATRRRHDPR